MFQIGKFPEVKKDSEGDVCPFLGLLEDPQTTLAFPSQWNACHRAKPSFSPNLDHQQMYCLTESHVTCPVFNKEAGEILPGEMRAFGTKPAARRRFFIPLLVAFLILGVGIIAGAWMIVKWRSDSGHQASPTFPLQRSGTLLMTVTPTPTVSASETSTLLFPGVTIAMATETATNTASPTPTVTPSPTEKPDTPTPLPTETEAPVQHPTSKHIPTPADTAVPPPNP